MFSKHQTRTLIKTVVFAVINEQLKQNFCCKTNRCKVIVCSTLKCIPYGIHILKLERYREDQHGPCARMTRKIVKRSTFFALTFMAVGKISFTTIFSNCFSSLLSSVAEHQSCKSSAGSTSGHEFNSHRRQAGNISIRGTRTIENLLLLSLIIFR